MDSLLGIYCQTGFFYAAETKHETDGRAVAGDRSEKCVPLRPTNGDHHGIVFVTRNCYARLSVKMHNDGFFSVHYVTVGIVHLLGHSSKEVFSLVASGFRDIIYCNL